MLSVFTLAGAVALAQEVAWSDLLARTLGHGPAAVSLVAAVFLAGLALGSVWGGRLATRSRHPLRLYGTLELGIGAASLAVLFLMPRLPALTAPLGRLLFHDSLGGVLVRALVLLPCLLPPTILMGATLPVLVRWRAADAGEAAWQSGTLAGLNAGGGALGAMAAVFVILPAVGTGRMLAATALLSLLAGSLVLLLARHPSRARKSTSRPALDPAARTLRLPRIFPYLLLAAGAASMTAQITWTRAMSWLFGPSVYAFGVLLAAIVAGMSLGQFLGAAPARRCRNPRLLFAGLEIGIGLSILLTVVALAHLAPPVAYLAAWSGQSVRWLQAGELAITVALFLVPAALMGAAFPVACRLMVSGGLGVGRGVGRASALLTAGNVVGALAAGFVIPILADSRQALLGAGVTFLVVGLLARHGGLGVERARRLPYWAGAGLGIAAILIMPVWDPALLASGPAFHGPQYVAAATATGLDVKEVMRARGSILFAEEGPDALVTVRRTPAGASLQINGRTEASTGSDMRAQILAGQIPFLHVSRPRRAMVIGLASGVTVGSVLRHPVDEVVVVEVAPTVVAAAASGAFDAASGRPLTDDRVHLITADARTLLLQDPSRYDLIASQPSNPWVPGVAGLYTVEFFRLVRLRLQPQGVFSQWLQGYGLSDNDFRRVLRTFAQVFPNCALYEESVGGGDYFLVGSPSKLSWDAARQLSRLTPAALSDLARVGMPSAAGIWARLVLDGIGMAAYAGDGELLTDDRLRLAYSAPLTLWQNTSTLHSRGMERHRRPPASRLDWSGLPDESRLPLLTAAAKEERQRREERSFLELLEQAEMVELADPRLAEALAHVRAGLPLSAYGLLADLLHRSPGPASLQVLAGDLAAQIGERELATLHYRTALRTAPDSSSALTGLGLVLLALGDEPAAINSFQSVLEYQPGTLRALFGLGSAYVQSGRYEEGAALLESVVTREPEWARAWSNLGVARRRLGRLAAAREAYQRALALDAGLSQAWYNLGLLLRQLDDTQGALQALTSGVEVAPVDCDLVVAWSEQRRSMGLPVDIARTALCESAGPTGAGLAER